MSGNENKLHNKYNNIEYYINRFVRGRNLVVFYSDDIPESPLVLWDPGRGGIEEFLNVFKNLEIENPVILWPNGVCLRVSGLFYCYSHPQEASDTSEESIDSEPDDELRSRLLAGSEGEAKALSYLEALLESDPVETAKWLASKLGGAGNALRNMRYHYSMLYAVGEYLSYKLGGGDSAEVVSWLQRIPGPRLRDFYEYMDSVRRELSRMHSIEKINKIREVFARCTDWFRQNGMRRPRKADMERCLVELGIQLSWSDRQALWSLIREELH